MHKHLGSTSQERVVIITGSDHNYFGLLSSAIESLLSSRDHFGFDLVVLDFGLSAEQRSSLVRSFPVEVVSPDWVVDVPAQHRTVRNLAFGVRCALPTVVPGYDIYFWFDCDSWVQNESFYHAYLQIARRNALAIAREDQKWYPFDWRLIRWNLGNQILGFGVLKGLRVYQSPFVNSGFFAVRGDHRLWSCWRERFEAAVHKSGRIIMDQHSLRACIVLDEIPVEYLDGEYNWICSRLQPVFDEENGLFCLPYPPNRPISIMHLAGQSKQVEYDLRCIGGGMTRKSLLFSSQPMVLRSPGANDAPECIQLPESI